MPYRRIPGVPGKVYVPQGSSPRKHRCPDCFRCQICSDDRCRCCLKLKARCKGRKKKKTKS